MSAGIDYLQQYMDWTRKNYFTLLGIILILCVVWWNYATIERRMVTVARDCNDFWVDQIVRSCPVLLNKNNEFNPLINGSMEIKITELEI